MIGAWSLVGLVDDSVWHPLRGLLLSLRLRCVAVVWLRIGLGGGWAGGVFCCRFPVDLCGEDLDRLSAFGGDGVVDLDGAVVVCGHLVGPGDGVVGEAAGGVADFVFKCDEF